LRCIQLKLSQAASLFRTHAQAKSAGDFEEFSFSRTLDDLLENFFYRLLEVRQKHRVGWAGAEELTFSPNTNLYDVEVSYLANGCFFQLEVSIADALGR